MSKMVGIPADQVDAVWPEIQPMVERVLAKVKEYRWEPEDVLRCLQDRDMQLWVSVDDKALCAMLITQLVRWPRCLECSLFMWAGRITDDSLEQLETVEQWAREQGCHYMSTLSRPGSAKFVGYNKGLIHTYKGL